MKNLKKPPLLMAGLVLGMLALGNLLGHYSNSLKYGLAGFAFIFYLILIIGIVRNLKQTKVELQSPIIASVFPTFFMAGMLFSSFVILNWQVMVAQLFWWLFFIGNLTLMAYYIWTFVIRFKWQSVFPSWTVLFVGVAMAGLTAPASHQYQIGQLIFWVCLVFTVAIFPVISKKVYKMGLPEANMPNISTFCAPLSLLLAAYLVTFPTPNHNMVIILTVSSQMVYLFVLVQLPKLINRPFNPGFSAFTFPYVISATSLKMSLGFLGLENSWKLLVHIEVAVATVLVVTVTALYIRFLAKKEAVV
ncbi:TDT family transporter [Streptococcus hongkongensis]